MKGFVDVLPWVIFVIVFVSSVPLNNYKSEPLIGQVITTISSPHDGLESELGGGNADEMGPYKEGDLIGPIPETQNGLVNETFRWPDGVVPYKIIGNFSLTRLEKIQTAFHHYHNVTDGCIRFIGRTDQHDYIQIDSDASGCHSNVGRRGGSQKVNLAPQCFARPGVIQHELLHALGFHHEHTRWDRDEYITINWDYLKNGAAGNFAMHEEDAATGFGFPYDYHSVMHYSNNAFSVNNTMNTITPVVPEAGIGQRKGLSDIDIEKLMKMYKCNENN